MTRWGGPGDSYRAHQDAIDDAVRRVLDSGWYILGEEVQRFEHAFGQFAGGRALGVASGTDAVALALLAVGVAPGDKVATVSHTAVATVAAVESVGAVPVLVDIDDVTMVMSVDSLAAAFEAHPGIRAVVAVHLYGHPAPMASICRIASSHGAIVVEDCAQAHGAMIDERLVGTWGAAAAYSFYPTKNLGALGDAGAVVLHDDEAFDRALMLRQYGWRSRYVSEIPGMNSRLDPLQAAVLAVKLEHLATENETRRQIAAAYDEVLPAVVRPPVVAPGAMHVFHQYVVRVSEGRDEAVGFLTERAVPVAVLYPVPVHLQPAYAGRVATSPSGMAVTEQVCRELLCLPVHPQMDVELTKAVATHVSDWAATR